MNDTSLFESDRLAPSAIRKLRNAFAGRLITPDSADYERARTLFYGGFDRLRPVAIVRPSDAPRSPRSRRLGPRPA